jgi:hypothetical protein
MELDASRPDETLSLTPAGGGEGPFPGGDAAEGAALDQVVVAPGQTRAYWAMFRGYRFPGSDVPRRITLTLPGASGPGLRVALGDPARGLLRWDIKPAASGWMYGGRSMSLYGHYAMSNAVSTYIARVFRAGRLLWDVGLVSTVLVQVRGQLISPTSSFAGTGFAAHLRRRSSGRGRTRAGCGGGGAQFRSPSSRRAGSRTPPHAYGEIDMDRPSWTSAPAAGLRRRSRCRSRAAPAPLVRARRVHAHLIGHGTAKL